MALPPTDRLIGFVARPVATFRAARNETVTDAAILRPIVAYSGTGAKVMGGRGDFADPFKSAVSSLLPGRTPIVGAIVWPWAIALLLPGVRELHEMNTTRAVTASLAGRPARGYARPLNHPPPFHRSVAGRAPAGAVSPLTDAREHFGIFR